MAGKLCTLYKRITINKEILLKHWNLQIGSLDLRLGLRPYCSDWPVIKLHDGETFAIKN